MESSHHDIALNELSSPRENHSPEVTFAVHDELDHHDLQSLIPPADGGRDAWLFLAAGFVVEAMVWGFPFSFGIFQEYYSTHPPFSTSGSSDVAIIGTTATGIMYLAGLILFPAYKIFPHLANTSKWLGIPVMACGLIAGSFANSVNELILTQGAIYAVGGCLIYYPTLLYIDEWFVRRKGFAFGIMWAGTGVAGLIIPFLLTSLLSKYGFRTTLRAWAITLVILATPLVYFIRPRLPIRPTSSTNQQWHLHPRNLLHFPRSLSFLRTSTFWVLELGLVIESLGYFLPTIYLPAYSTSISSRLSHSSSTTTTSSSTTQPLLISLLNLATVFSTILFGALIDHYHVTTIILISTLGSTTSIFLFWGLSSLSFSGPQTSIALIYLFSIFYGFFAGGFVATNAGMIKLVKSQFQVTHTPASSPRTELEVAAGEDSEVVTSVSRSRDTQPRNTSDIGEREQEAAAPDQIDVGLLIAFISAGRGIGAIVSGPLSDVLVNFNATTMSMQGGKYGGGGYENLIIFTGVTAAVGGASFMGRWVGWL